MQISEFTFQSPDRLTLHGASYNAELSTHKLQPIICLHGLTRNERDFEDLALWLANTPIGGTAFDVYCLSFRGRGLSARDSNYLNYTPVTYVDDVIAMTKALRIANAIFIGTSLGGIVTMLLADAAPHLMRAAILNDIGPDLAPEGLARIAGYVAGGSTFVSWEEAAHTVKAINAVAFPHEADNPDFWLAFARRCCREEGHNIILDYDPLIAKALAEADPAPDLWLAFNSFTCPVLSIRGATSDLFTAEIQDTMKECLPTLAICSVPGIGHAPMLDEPAAKEAIRDFLGTL